jgi:uridine kinase
VNPGVKLSDATNQSTDPNPLIIGIAGGTGSGKTTVAQAISAALGAEHCAVIDHDAYYRDLAHVAFEQRVKVNFDHPESLENELLARHLDRLKDGETIAKPVYNFAEHIRANETVAINPRPVIVVEGILVLAIPALRKRLDVKIFVDTDADVRLMRRVRRDMRERGRDFDEIRKQYYGSVRPMHLQFVEPSRRHADLIIPEGGDNRVAIGMVVRSLFGMLKGLPSE